MQSFAALVAAFESRFSQELPFPDEPGNLYDPCRYLLGLGGKRVRPVLCLMTSELLGEINEDAWHAAEAIELLHNFTLIHDDIMDKAPLRRGNPTVHHKYGMTAGILGGDVMCIYAYESLVKIRKSLPQIIRAFNRAAIEICEGQQMDMDFESRNDVSIDEYLRMIMLKTSVLLACSLKIGAVSGGALGDTAGKLYDFGINLGLAFQLQDDYLDAFGDPALLGKLNGGDIIANKKTFLLLKALENADTAQKSQIADLLKSDSDEKVQLMLALYTATGADAACKETIADYSQRAFACLEDVAVPAVRKQPLVDLANYLLVREK